MIPKPVRGSAALRKEDGIGYSVLANESQKNCYKSLRARKDAVFDAAQKLVDLGRPPTKQEQKELDRHVEATLKPVGIGPYL